MASHIARVALGRAVRDAVVSANTADAIFVAYGDDVTIQLEALQNDPMFMDAA